MTNKEKSQLKAKIKRYRERASDYQRGANHFENQLNESEDE